MTVVANRKAVILVLVDNGSCMTLIDLQMARDLHLAVEQASNGEFGSYLVPGLVEVKPYHGRVDGRFRV